MFCLSLETTDPFLNLAVEELLLKNSMDEFLILGINERSAIIGKHQVAHRETETRFVSENEIPVIRRISGGGTVFHDKGNLNFTFILNSEKGNQVNFRKYTLPVISFLSSIGIDAIFESKNDLKVNGLKISGNAEHVYHNRVLHHGTLLYDTDLESLNKSIRKDVEKYITRAVSSNPSSVTNIKEVLKDHLKDHLNIIHDISEFRSGMINWFLRNFPGMKLYQLPEDEKKMAENLAITKYRTWEWNYAYGPEYQFNNIFEVEGNKCTCRLFVRDGKIRECEIKGLKHPEMICKKLTGCRHMVEDLLEIFPEKPVIGNGFDVYNLF